MHRHIRQISPVNQSGRQPVMLAERKPVPNRIRRRAVALSVLAKVPDQVTFEPLSRAAQSYQPCLQLIRRIRQPAKREVWPKARDGLCPRPLVKSFDQISPACYTNLFHRYVRSTFYFTYDRFTVGIPSDATGLGIADR